MSFRRTDWGTPLEELPVIGWTEYRRRVEMGQVLVVVEGVVHDLGAFLAENPGGEAAVKGMLGKDATALFNGGVYDHSRAAVGCGAEGWWGGGALEVEGLFLR
ncbi:acyl-CoA desaturase [Aspergillus bombycis]|uniref:Acyl-CoA desaturase n=1 Tax=Aspergillus bombycis TaxID=109264 RepID=A0A1F7ZIF2_9EURO|nr:acyl-CoA desaturase [Aspergillus bombycis]OGM39236.1 acyl-CoA desaturase [Aspergillus bombycis]